MPQHWPVIQWLCLSLLLCFLSLAISSEANATEASNSFATEAQLQSQNKTLEERTPGMSSNPSITGKNGDSLENIAKFAIETNNETVKRIETFYSTTVQIFLGTITVFAVLAGVIGSVAVGHIAKAAAKTHAKEIMDPLKADLRVEFNQVLDALRAEFKQVLEEFQRKAMSDLRGLRSAILARAQITSYMENISKAKDEDKSIYESQRQEARRLITEVLDEIQPEDKKVLSLAYSVLGVILFFDHNFEAAIVALRKSEQNPSADFNRACCACRLADEIEKRDGDKVRIAALEDEALSALRQVLEAEPWRKAEARREAETGDLRRIRQNPRFIELV